MPCDDCSRAETCPPCVNETEPKGSERSSPDEDCHGCTHPRKNHDGGTCSYPILTYRGPLKCLCTKFVPAAGETAGEPECTCTPRDDGLDNECVQHPLHVGPEAPDDPSLDHLCQECPHPRRVHVHFGEERQPTCMYCTSENDAYSHEFARATPERDEQWRREAREEWARVLARKSASSRRPPYAVAYELEDGTAYEVALPGDATVGSFNGALVITHTSSPVRGLTQARPMEGQ